MQKKWVRQYKIDSLSFEVDLCFFVHKLIIEVDEGEHIYHDEEKHQIRQKLIESIGFSFIRIRKSRYRKN